MFYHDEKKKNSNKIAKQKNYVQAGKSTPTIHSIFRGNQCNKIWKEPTGRNHKIPLRLPKSSISGERGGDTMFLVEKLKFGKDVISPQMHL